MENYQLYFDEAPVGIIILNQNGVCLAANSQVCKLTGYTKEEINGFSIIDLLCAENFLTFFHVGRVVSYTRKVITGVPTAWASLKI